MYVKGKTNNEILKRVSVNKRRTERQIIFIKQRRTHKGMKVASFIVFYAYCLTCLTTSSITTTQVHLTKIENLLGKCTLAPLQKLGTCIQHAANTARSVLRYGIPKFHFPVLDPARIGGPLIINISAGDIGVEAKMDNITATGLSKAIMTNIKINYEKMRVHVEVFIPEFRHDGRYTLNMNKEILQIRGNGTYWMMHSGMKLTLDTHIITPSIDGQERLQIKNSTLEYVEYDLQFKFLDLIPVSETLNDFVNNLMYQHQHAVLGRMKPIIGKFMANYAEGVINSVFKKIDLEKIVGYQYLALSRAMRNIS